MNTKRMAKDAHRVFRRHPEWVYGAGHSPSPAELRRAIEQCIGGCERADQVATGRFLAQKDENGYIEVALILGDEYGV